MNVLILDVETTTSNKGHWADKTNKLVMAGIKWLGNDPVTFIRGFNEIQNDIKVADIVVGFNIKFDLHWLLNVGIDVSKIKRIWDVQIAEFLLEAQRNPHNSLNAACDKYGIERKLDVVKTEYWDKGIDTDEIPPEILREYLDSDLDRTERVFKKQYEIFTGIRL